MSLVVIVSMNTLSPWVILVAPDDASTSHGTLDE